MFLDAGYTPSLFWDSSMDEIIDLLDSAARNVKRDAELQELNAKLDIKMLQVQAQQIVEFLSMLLPGDDKDKRITPLSKFYPSLWPEADTDNQQSDESQLALHKAKMEDYMFWNNRKFKGGD